MIDLESKFEVLEAEVKEINANKETLKRNLLDLIELQHILNKTQTFFMEVCSPCRDIHVHVLFSSDTVVYCNNVADKM